MFRSLDHLSLAGDPGYSLWDPPLDRIWDCQVIVPLNEKSDVSRKALNPKLQNYLNPDGKRAEGNQFREGDKIVCGKNGWYNTFLFNCFVSWFYLTSDMTVGKDSAVHILK